jgi:hypothetical protein
MPPNAEPTITAWKDTKRGREKHHFTLTTMYKENLFLSQLAIDIVNAGQRNVLGRP